MYLCVYIYIYIHINIYRQIRRQRVFQAFSVPGAEKLQKLLSVGP